MKLLGRQMAGGRSVISPAKSGKGGKDEILPSSFILDVSFTFIALASGLAVMYFFVVLADSGAIDGHRLKLHLALLAPMVTMCAYVSPFPVVVDAIRQMNVQNLPTQVFYLQAICNVLSISYGIQIMNTAVLATNMIGLFCQVIFLCGDHLVRASNSHWFGFSLKATLLMNTGLYISTKLAPLNILGHSIILFNLLMFASPLTKFPRILRSRNASTLPFAMTFLQLCNNAIWTLYALFIQDIVVLLPSILGYLLSGIQVLVILWCQGSLPFDLMFLLIFCPKVDKTASPKGDNLRTEDSHDTEMQALHLSSSS